MPPGQHGRKKNKTFRNILIGFSFSAFCLISGRRQSVYCGCPIQCQFRPQYLNNNRLSTINGWTRGSYQCLCKQGFYSIRHPEGYNGIMQFSMLFMYILRSTFAQSVFLSSFKQEHWVNYVFRWWQVPSWKLLTRSTSATPAHTTATHFCVCLVWRDVSAVLMQLRAWLSTTGLSGQQQFHFDWLFQVNLWTSSD